MNFLKLVKERLKVFFILMKEGYKFEDKMHIFNYHLKAPIQTFNYFLGKKNSRKLPGNVYLKNKYGLFFCGDNFSSVVGVSSFCEPEVRKEVVLDKGVAIDIGANCGMYTVPLAKSLGKKGKVISIEAEQKNIELLKKNIKLNKLTNVFVIGKGAYSKKGKIDLNIDEYGTGGHSIQKTEVSEFKNKQKIEIDTIDNIVKDLKMKEINLMKIDVEGAELEVLKGAKKTLQKFHPRIIFEALNSKEKENIENFLSKYKYNYKRIGPWNYLAE